MSKQQVDIFTPKNLKEYIGQERAKEIISILSDSAYAEKRPVPNLLIAGSFGLGKTTLATLFFKRHRYKFIEHNAATLSILKDMYAYSEVTLAPGNYLVDEIHNIPPQYSDSLHSGMDKGYISVVGMTTNPGKLTAAFRSRFYLITLEPYSITDMQKIISNIIKRKKIYTVTSDSISEIAKRSRQTARTAVQNTQFIFDFANINKVSKIDLDVVLQAFEKLGVDDRGLTIVDHKYLNSLPNDRPVGVQYISSKIGVDIQTIEEEIEPFLMREGFIDRNNKGRFKLNENEDDLLEKLEQSVKKVSYLDSITLE